MQTITKINGVVALMTLYHPGKFESTSTNRSWDIFLTSPATEQQQKINKKCKKAKTKDLDLHANLITAKWFVN